MGGAMIVSGKELKKFCKRSFEKVGLSDADAELVTDTLVQSEAMGISSHGIVRLPFYCRRLIDKGTKTTPKIKILVEKASVILLDGDNGLGQVISISAMKQVMQKAKTSGICFGGVKNSCHFGMAGYYAMMALKNDMIGVAASNAPPVMAAWGGRKSAIGNNPLAVAVPTAKEFPLVLDISMSVVAGGKVRLAAVNKEKIPLNWIIDAQGKPTNRPDDFFAGGTLLPLGHKGFGLAIMVEILAGVLTGAGVLGEMKLWLKDTAAPIDNGHFFIAIDIGTFCDIDIFKKRMNHMIDELKSCPPSEGSKGVLMPGELEYEKACECRERGFLISNEVLRSLNDFALEIGIAKLITT
jgi:LDH2 family malate/lactate/ureidoglycolate dehydrogenase